MVFLVSMTLWGWLMKTDLLRTSRVERIVTETDDVSSIFFFDEPCQGAVPGQYVMIWVPGVDEVPMSLSSINQSGMASITVRSVGEATNALCSLKTGAVFGVKGPFGKGFTLMGKKPLIIGGGTGTAALLPLIEQFIVNGITPTTIIGSQTIGQLLFRERLMDLLGDKLIEATDDGTCGFHGFASECAIELLERSSFDQIYACGPELMLASIYNVSAGRNIPLQVSLERYIKCAVGLCGSCLIGPYRVCKDGPVFASEILSEVEAYFGKKRMDPSGKTITVTH